MVLLVVLLVQIEALFNAELLEQSRCFDLPQFFRGLCYGHAVLLAVACVTSTLFDAPADRPHVAANISSNHGVALVFITVEGVLDGSNEFVCPEHQSSDCEGFAFGGKLLLIFTCLSFPPNISDQSPLEPKQENHICRYFLIGRRGATVVLRSYVITEEKRLTPGWCCT